MQMEDTAPKVQSSEQEEEEETSTHETRAAKFQCVEVEPSDALSTLDTCTPPNRRLRSSMCTTVVADHDSVDVQAPQSEESAASPPRHPSPASKLRSSAAAAPVPEDAGSEPREPAAPDTALVRRRSVRSSLPAHCSETPIANAKPAAAAVPAQPVADKAARPAGVRRAAPDFDRLHRLAFARMPSIAAKPTPLLPATSQPPAAKPPAAKPAAPPPAAAKPTAPPPAVSKPGSSRASVCIRPAVGARPSVSAKPPPPVAQPGRVEVTGKRPRATIDAAAPPPQPEKRQRASSAAPSAAAAAAPRAARASLAPTAREAPRPQSAPAAPGPDAAEADAGAAPACALGARGRERTGYKPPAPFVVLKSTKGLTAAAPFHLSQPRPRHPSTAAAGSGAGTENRPPPAAAAGVGGRAGLALDSVEIRVRSATHLRRSIAAVARAAPRRAVA
jgi:hypothetical protein